MVFYVLQLPEPGAHVARCSRHHRSIRVQVSRSGPYHPVHVNWRTLPDLRSANSVMPILMFGLPKMAECGSECWCSIICLLKCCLNICDLIYDVYPTQRNKNPVILTRCTWIPNTIKPQKTEHKMWLKLNVADRWLHATCIVLALQKTHIEHSAMLVCYIYSISYLLTEYSRHCLKRQLKIKYIR